MVFTITNYSPFLDGQRRPYSVLRHGGRRRIVPQVTRGRFGILPGMPRSATERRIYARDRADVRSAVERAVTEVGMRLDPPEGEWEVRASRPASLMTWGERIHVVTATNPGGGTQVVVESRLAFGLLDWGRNRENVQAILAALDGALGPGEPAS
jgi:hypothetical protein